jgi:hypothetical protein
VVTTSLIAAPHFEQWNCPRWSMNAVFPHTAQTSSSCLNMGISLNPFETWFGGSCTLSRCSAAASAAAQSGTIDDRLWRPSCSPIGRSGSPKVNHIRCGHSFKSRERAAERVIHCSVLKAEQGQTGVPDDAPHGSTTVCVKELRRRCAAQWQNDKTRFPGSSPGGLVFDT